MKGRNENPWRVREQEPCLSDKFSFVALRFPSCPWWFKFLFAFLCDLKGYSTFREGICALGGNTHSLHVPVVRFPHHTRHRLARFDADRLINHALLVRVVTDLDKA
jgi:hypothetical protein